MSSLVSPPNCENERRVSMRDYARQSHRVTTLGATCAPGVYFENIRGRERRGREWGGCCWRPMRHVNDRKPAIWTWRLGTAPRTAVTYRQTAGYHRRSPPSLPRFLSLSPVATPPPRLGYLTLVINCRSSTSLAPRYVAGTDNLVRITSAPFRRYT